jgi:uncharacterized protein YndB with AHSA1/START domain
MAAKNKPNEIQLTRIYDASVKAVWDAWTDPKQVAQWWGPRGFTLTTKSKDVRSGGSWLYTMHGLDGTDYPNKTHFLEVEKYSRLVYDHGANDDRPPLFRVTVLFSEINGKTKMEMTSALPTAEAAIEIRKFIKQAGGDSTWDRLAEFLVKENSGKEKFVVNRTFKTPIATMFEMWTDPKHFSKWLPPAGFDMTFLKCDIKSGGRSFYCMSNSSGMKMYGRAEYLEVARPNRVFYTQQFCDENEKVTRHPMAPLWPETMLTTVTLAEDGPEETRVTIVWEIHGKATPEEIATFVNAKSGMTQGWTGSFDKLDAYLEKA